MQLAVKQWSNTTHTHTHTHTQHTLTHTHTHTHTWWRGRKPRGGNRSSGSRARSPPRGRPAPPCHGQTLVKLPWSNTGQTEALPEVVRPLPAAVKLPWSNTGQTAMVKRWSNCHGQTLVNLPWSNIGQTAMVKHWSDCSGRTAAKPSSHGSGREKYPVGV